MGCILPNDKGVGPGLLENWSRAECLHHEFLTSCRLSFKNLKRVLTYDSVTLTLHVPSCTHEEHIQILKAKQSDHPQVNGALFHNGFGFAFGLRSPPRKYIYIYIYIPGVYKLQRFPEKKISPKNQNPE